MISASRTKAILLKEIRDYRRNRFVVVTMCVLPILFLTLPVTELFTIDAAKSTTAVTTVVGLDFLYLLFTPVILPAVIAAYSVVGEREQGTLEPVLTTPVRTQEFILGKAIAAFIPSISISYAMLTIFLVLADLFAKPVVTNTVFRGPTILAEFLFAPLLCGWAIWVCIAISARSNDIRVAQQLGSLASLPPLGLASLLSFGVIKQTFALALIVGGVLVVLNLFGVRIVSTFFDRERLVTGKKAFAGAATTTATSTPTSTTQHPAGVDPATGEPTAAATSTLSLTRRRGGIVDRSTTWNVEVDGAVIGTIPPQLAVVDFPVPAGRHTLRLRHKRHISKERTFDVGEGDTVSFWCRAAMFWPQWLAATFKPDIWISLHQD